MDVLLQPKWTVVFLVAFGAIAWFAWQRRRDRKWIEERFGENNVIASSFGVRYFGMANEPGRPHRLSGVLLLLPDRLFFKARMSPLELDIPGSRILRVHHGRRHKGVDLNQSVVKVDFLNALDEEDTAAFKVPYPPQWIKATATAFSLKKVEKYGNDL